MAKVLLVEDDNNLREIYQARLTAEGYDIVAAQNGEDALVLAKQHHPDLIISDVMMPRISGYEMLDILRNTDELKHTKVIMLTALGQNEDKERAGKLGADKYLVKSQVTLEDIVNSAKALLADDSVGTPQATTTDPSDPLGMGATSQTDDAILSAVSPVATTITPLGSVSDPADAPEPSEVAAVEPAIEPKSDVVPAPVSEEPANNSAVEPSESVPSEPTEVAIEAPSLINTELTPAVEPGPISVEDLINSQPTASAPVVEAAQAEVSAAQSTENEQALVDEQIASFNQAAAPVAEAAPAVETPEQDNDATLDDALQALTKEEPEAPAPAFQPVASAPETVAPQPSHDIEGLSGVTEVVEVPAEPHVDPTPSTTASVIQPEIAEPTSEVVVAQPQTPEAAPTPMTQTVVPTEMPQPPAEAAPTEPENDGVNVVGKKVIQPITDPNSKPDLDKLLAQEEAKDSGEAVPQPTAQPVVEAPVVPAPSTAPQSTQPPQSQTSFDPNKIAL